MAYCSEGFALIIFSVIQKNLTNSWECFHNFFHQNFTSQFSSFGCVNDIKVVWGANYDNGCKTQQSETVEVQRQWKRANKSDDIAGVLPKKKFHRVKAWRLFNLTFFCVNWNFWLSSHWLHDLQDVVVWTGSWQTNGPVNDCWIFNLKLF